MVHVSQKKKEAAVARPVKRSRNRAVERPAMCRERKTGPLPAGLQGWEYVVNRTAKKTDDMARRGSKRLHRMALSGSHKYRYS
jgi:hypothetical protein